MIVHIWQTATYSDSLSKVALLRPWAFLSLMLMVGKRGGRADVARPPRPRLRPAMEDCGEYELMAIRIRCRGRLLHSPATFGIAF